MRTAITTSALVLLVALATPTAFATQHGPLARIGTVKYNYTGATQLTDEVKASVGEFYINYLEGDLVNGGTSMGVRDELLEEVKRVREETNRLNNGLGAWVPEIDEHGNFFGGHYEKYEGDLPEVPFRLEATMNVFERPENRQRFDMNINVNIVDAKTGEVVGHTSVWKRDTAKYLNERIIGPEPTWVERYLTGYVREITYDDPLQMAIAEAAKDLAGKLADLNQRELVADGERFFRQISDQQRYAKSVEESGYRPIVPDEIRHPRAADRETKTTDSRGETAWGDASAWETAYEQYFWVYVQGHGLYSNFWDFYNGDGYFSEHVRTSYPMGEPVDLRAYFNTPGVKDYYEQFRATSRSADPPNTAMPTLDEVLSSLDTYQENLSVTEPPESEVIEPVPAESVPIEEGETSSESVDQDYTDFPERPAGGVYAPGSGGGWTESR